MPFLSLVDRTRSLSPRPIDCQQEGVKDKSHRQITQIHWLRLTILLRQLFNAHRETDALSETDAERTITISWEDPRPLAEAGRGMSGFEFLQKIVAGDLPRPPLSSLMNFQIVELEEGRAVFAVNPAEYHYNPIGVVHGGLAATLLDSAMGCAIHSMLPAGSGYTTLELKVNFIRAMTAETGRVRAEGKLIHLGGRTATAEGRVIDDSGKLYAHATTTCLVLRQ